MEDKFKRVLSRIADLFNKENIIWALGASSVLYYHNLVSRVNDLDIVVHRDSLSQLEKILLDLGQKEDTKPSASYSNYYFGEFTIDEVEIDVMCDMVINNHGATYFYEFNQTSIVDSMIVNKVKVPMTSLEEWYILYQMIPNRDDKVKLIESYFEKHTVQHPILLSKTTGLPKFILKNIDNLLCQVK